FIVGVHSKYEGILDELQNLFIDTIHGEKGKVNFCLWDAIFDLPEIEAKTAQNRTYYECKRWGYTYGQFIDMCTPYAKLINNGYVGKMPVLNHKSKYNNTRDIEIYSRLLPGEKSDAESIKDINPYKNRAGIFKDKFYKLLPNEPCKTITAHMYYDCHMYIHPYSARGLSPREAARVQGFPDDYLFLGTPNEWYRQIGNAVSPLLARVLGKGLKNILKRIYRV
ncbi:MAG: DNA cytosine methyltransferase, partial [Clostridiales bacterium]|nr:DNA cytosine methyltransferase [Clostridiales bacterium]